MERRFFSFGVSGAGITFLRPHSSGLWIFFLQVSALIKDSFDIINQVTLDLFKYCSASLVRFIIAVAGEKGRAESKGIFFCCRITLYNEHETYILGMVCQQVIGLYRSRKWIETGHVGVENEVAVQSMFHLNQGLQARNKHGFVKTALLKEFFGQSSVFDFLKNLRVVETGQGYIFQIVETCQMVEILRVERKLQNGETALVSICNFVTGVAKLLPSIGSLYKDIVFHPVRLSNPSKKKELPFAEKLLSVFLRPFGLFGLWFSHNPRSGSAYN